MSRIDKNLLKQHEEFKAMTEKEKQDRTKRHFEERAKLAGISVEEFKRRLNEASKKLSGAERGEPSSAEGRELYISRIGFLESLTFPWECFKRWFNGDKVWYSKEGQRVVTITRLTFRL